MSEQQQGEILRATRPMGVLRAPFAPADLFEEAMDTLENFAGADPAFGQSETCNILRVYLLAHAFGIIGDFGKRRDEAMRALRAVENDCGHDIRNAEHWRAQIAFLDAHVASAKRVVRKSQPPLPPDAVEHDRGRLQ